MTATLSFYAKGNADMSGVTRVISFCRNTAAAVAFPFDLENPR